MIATHNLFKSYIRSPFPDFSASSGDFILICGKTGSGKTTLCDIIAGFTPADSGIIILDDKDINTTNRFQYMHYISQIPDHNLIGPTAKEEIKLWHSNVQYPVASIQNHLDTDTLDNTKHWLLDTGHSQLTTGYSLDTPIWKLSFGQKKALAFHCLTLVKRKIWLLDEPFAGADDDLCTSIKTLMRDHIADGGIVIATSHTADSFTEFKTKITKITESVVKYILISLFLLLNTNLYTIHPTSDTLNTSSSKDKLPRYELDELRVIATKPSESAGNIEILYLDDNTKAEELHLSDLLKNVSGLSISTGGKGESNLQIRGFRKENVKIMIDGRQINGGYFGNVNLAEMPIFDVSEVHILRGAVSPLYGVNSSGGVVNFVSRPPSNKYWLTIRSSIQRNNTQSLQLITAHQFDLWDYWVNISAYRTDGFMLSKNFQPTSYENGAVRNFSHNKSLDIQSKFNMTLYDSHSLGVAFGYTFSPERNVPNNIYERRYRRFTDWRRYNISTLTSFQITPNLVIKPSVSYDAYDNTLNEFTDKEMTNKTLHSILETWTFSPQLRTEFIVSQRGKLYHLYKWEKQLYNRKDDGSYREWTTNKTHLHNTSLLYSQDFSGSISSSISAGASQSSRIFTAYRVGATQETINTKWYLEPALSIHYDDKVNTASLAISRNIQYPTLHHLYSSTRGNVYLKPEQILKTEISIGRLFTFPHSTLKIENNIYHNHIDGLIDRVNSPKFLNQRQLQNAGYELSLTSRLWNRVETSHQFSYINLSMNKDYTFAEIPVHTLYNSLSIDILPPSIKDEVRGEKYHTLKMSYSINFSDFMLSPDENGNLHRLPEKTLHNIGLNYRHKNYKLAFTMSNLFDLNYSEEYGYPSPGRNYSFSVEWVVF